MIKFGASGNSESFYNQGHKHTEESAVFIKEMGLDCFEYSFGRGVLLGTEKAISICDAFKSHDVEISVHAPYFINFANESDEMINKSFNYVLDSASAVKKMGGKRIVFHPASQGKLSREDAFKLTLNNIQRLRDLIYINNLEDMYFCPETMGKIAQIGTIEEITEICKIDKCFLPAVDFGHVNARENGSLNSKEDFTKRLIYMIDNLGIEKMQNFEVHFSKIQYSKKGEVKHLTFEDEIYGPRYEPFIEAIKSLDINPYVICESAGTQAEDALKMKQYYNRI